jgi:hypothetical protein
VFHPNSSEPIELSGQKRELEEEIESDSISPYQIKLKKIKVEDPYTEKI